MFSNQIPSAIQIFNKESIERKNNVREILGLKKINNSYSGLYGVDFCFENVSVHKSKYIPCLEIGCSFRGPPSMMDFHFDTVHKSGLDKRFDVETETWRKTRKISYPKSCNVNSKSEISQAQHTKSFHHNAKNRKNNINISDKMVEQSEPVSSDPMFTFLENRITENQSDSNDLLGLGALYGSSDEETLTKQQELTSTVVDEFSGLPNPSQLDPKQILPRRNRYRFPILPQMDLQSKRSALMNPHRKYQDNYNRKAKRPRLADLLLAEDISSERSMVLQCIRFLVNKRFFDSSLQNVSISVNSTEDNTARMSRTELTKSDDEMELGQEREEDDDQALLKDDEDQSLVWSDNDF